MLDVHDMGHAWRVMRVAGGLQAIPWYGTVLVSRDEEFAEIWRREYPSFMAMPERTRVSVAVLRMYPDNEKVPGIGRRISDNTFWLDDSPEIMEEYGDVC